MGTASEWNSYLRARPDFPYKHQAVLSFHPPSCTSVIVVDFFLGMGRCMLLVCVLLLIDLCSSVLVEQQPLVVTYHNGPLLTTIPTVDVYVIWYGRFSPVQRSIVADFVQSLETSKAMELSVYSWWKTTERYSGGSNQASVISSTRLGNQKLDEGYSLGKYLKRSDIAALVETAIASRALPENGNAVYLVLTSDDVAVEGFCMSCGFHANLLASKNLPLPYAWVGNSETQCPGQCAWPFHQPMYGPQTPPLVAPNGDIGIDGMINNIATVLQEQSPIPLTPAISKATLLHLWRPSLPARVYMEKGLILGSPGSYWWIKRPGQATMLAELMGGIFCCQLCGIPLPDPARH